MSKCKYCGAPIRFECTKNGNLMPCDPKAIYYIPDRDGNICVLTNSGEVVKAREGTEPGNTVRVGFVPHFVTCSAEKKQITRKRKHKYVDRSEEYRKKKEAAEAAENERIMKRCAEIQAAYEAEQREKQLSMLPENYIGWARRW